MCKMRVVVRRECLGSREQCWSLWSGKEIMEYTGNQIKSLIKSGQKVCGLALKENELVPDAEGFFTTNIMEHRYCGNYTPMIENENVMANVFYIVIGSHEEKGVVYYNCISTKFEQASFATLKRVMYSACLAWMARALWKVNHIFMRKTQYWEQKRL